MYQAFHTQVGEIYQVSAILIGSDIDKKEKFNGYTYLTVSNKKPNKYGTFVISTSKKVKGAKEKKVIFTFKATSKISYLAIRSANKYYYANARAISVKAKDTTKPVIKLNGKKTVNIYIKGKYKDAGAKASDNKDGDITKRIVVKGAVNVNKAGKYRLSYNVKDKAGNKAKTVVRTIIVKEHSTKDTTKPVIKLNGKKTVNIYIKGKYKDAGAKASDNKDGDITKRIVVTGTVNVNKAGTYRLSYNVKDKAGNKANTAIRTIIVKKKSLQIIDCNAFDGNELINVTKTSKLEGNCPKNLRFIIKGNNITFDCNNVKLIGTTKSKTKTAIHVTGYGKKIGTNIRIKNCNIEGYKHALRIQRASNTSILNSTPNDLRKKSPSNIKILNFKSVNSVKTAIFIDNHVHHVLLDKIDISKAGTAGIYLEYGTQHTTIQNSNFHDNNVGKRETIAIDSSAYNTIKNNTFRNNTYGDIYLYRNCGEKKNGKYIYRTQSSKLNNIIGNKFIGGDISIWVASRQSRGIINKDRSSCNFDRAYGVAKNNNNKKHYYPDFAEKNRILGNNFFNTKKAIIVEDDYTEIFGNSFSSKVKEPITIGTSIPKNITFNNSIKPKKSVIRHSIAFNTFFKRGSSIRNMIRYTPGTKKRVECSNIGKHKDGTRYLFSDGTKILCSQKYKDIIKKSKKYIIENSYSKRFLDAYYD